MHPSSSTAPSAASILQQAATGARLGEPARGWLPLPMFRLYAPTQAAADQAAMPMACAFFGRSAGSWQTDELDATAFDAPVDYIGLQDLVPALLSRVQVLQHGSVVYQVDSLEDSRGQRISAGELVQAMALEDGLGPLTLDLRHLGLRLLSARLYLWLPLSALPQARGIKAHALLG